MVAALTGKRRRTRASFLIKRNLEAAQARAAAAGEKWHSDAEKKFNEYQESRGMGLEWDNDIDVEDWQTGDKYTFQCDFLHKNDMGEYDIDYEIDGRKFHKKKTKEHWKDDLKNKKGLKVIHIPAEACVKKQFWAVLDDELPKAVLSEKPIIYIDEYA